MTATTHARFCLFLLALFLAGAVLAAPAAALRVEGARIALDVEPGKTYTAPIGISLRADEPGGDFAVDVLGFGQSPADGTYVGLEAANDTSPYTARPFIAIQGSPVRLEAGGRTTLNATISVPADVREGGRYAILLVHPAATATGAPASFATAVAIPVFLTVKGAAVSDSGTIEELGPASVPPGRPFEATATLRNSGNRHVYGVVQHVTVTDAGGATVATAKTQPLERALVPGNAVRSAVTVNQTLAAGTYRLTSRMETRDGALLAERTEALQVGAAASTTANRATPGFGAPAAVLVLAGLGAGGLFRRRRGGE